MTTLSTTVKLALLIQYPDKYSQRRVKLVEFDDYWLLFAWYMAIELIRQTVFLPVMASSWLVSKVRAVKDALLRASRVGIKSLKSLCVWRTRHAEAVKKAVFGLIHIPYAAG